MIVNQFCSGNVNRCGRFGNDAVEGQLAYDLIEYVGCFLFECLLILEILSSVPGDIINKGSWRFDKKTAITGDENLL